MQRFRFDQDIRPVSEFRAHAASLLDQLRRSRRPMVLTQRGRSAAVVLDVTAYEATLDELELLRDILTSERQMANGEGILHERARDQVLAALGE